MSLQDQIDAFLNGTPHAVVGASTNRAKYGNKVLRCYLQHGRAAVAINPNFTEVEGVRAFARLADVPGAVHGVSIITPLAVTERIVEEAGALGIKHVWMQPGAESLRAVERARELGMSVIAGGPCLLVALGYDDH